MRPELPELKTDRPWLAIAITISICSCVISIATALLIKPLTLTAEEKSTLSWGKKLKDIIEEEQGITEKDPIRKDRASIELLQEDREKRRIAAIKNDARKKQIKVLEDALDLDE